MLGAYDTDLKVEGHQSRCCDLNAFISAALALSGLHELHAGGPCGCAQESYAPHTLFFDVGEDSMHNNSTKTTHTHMQHGAHGP